MNCWIGFCVQRGMKCLAVFVAAVLLLSTPVAQAFQATPAVTIQSLAGHYQGTATSPQGTVPVTADLRLVDGKPTGSLDSGDGPIAITGAVLIGDQVVLTLDMGGSPGNIKGLAKGGRIEGEWTLGGMSGTLALTRTGDAQAPATQPAQAKPQPFTTHAKLEVVVPNFPAEGLILDVGGGGEGVIGQLKGRQVVAIDLLKQELDEAPGQPLLKIVMDARDLKFTDASFPTATVFFTFMYIDPADHEKVFREIHRVLEPGGRLLVWDPVFPVKQDPAHVKILFPLHVTLPAKEINTGYGARFREGQAAEHFVGLAGKTGFEVVSRRNEAGWFFLELKKGE
jgi:SAM-dependent methyltransferase